MQNCGEESLPEQLQKEEKVKEDRSADKARLEGLDFNINYWRRWARERKECYTCRRKLAPNEMESFMQVQVRRCHNHSQMRMKSSTRRYEA